MEETTQNCKNCGGELQDGSCATCPPAADAPAAAPEAPAEDAPAEAGAPEAPAEEPAAEGGDAPADPVMGQ